MRTEIDGRFSKQELVIFVEMTRTYWARVLEMIGKGNTLDEYQRSFLPRGRLLKGLYGEVLYFDPNPDEYPSPGLGGGKAMKMARMSHQQRYRHCLTKGHIFDMYHGINMTAFLDYTRVASKLFSDVFDPRIDTWIDEIANHPEYQEID